MRIIGGALKGIRLSPPANLPVRPTTDLAKEALFTILEYRILWEETEVLDLFSGTGNIAFESASRGAKAIIAVDQHVKCCAYIKQQQEKLHIDQLKVVKANVFKFLASCKQQFDFIFADPPYDLPQLPLLPNTIWERDLLKPAGIFVLEHPSTRKISSHPNLVEQRQYGYSSFSIFQR
ncbi:RsmD family RNA methyltransferase [Olivibacter ginsenosidimutans]|uniref:RsmD family RNA methyltransferase n=1 Tax=Olivibacter ginsenosidimutans TaxID=1176537 RepID=A0ABP9B2K0_9SPHI